MRSCSSLGMKFLLAIGLFSTAFSFFLIHQTWKSSHASLRQMLSQQAELAMAFEIALEDISHEPDTLISNQIESAERFSAAEKVFEKVGNSYRNVVIRAGGDQLNRILNQVCDEGDHIYRIFEDSPTLETLDRVVKFNGRDYLTKFRMQRNGRSLAQPRSELRMIAIPLEGYRSQINEATIRRSSPLMFALLGLFAAIYVSFRFLVGGRLKKIAAHFCRVADQQQNMRFMPLENRSRDEIGLLAENFNSMGENLENLCQTLDAQVHKRTLELQRVNRTLRQKMSQCQQAEEHAKILAHEATVASRAKSDFLANMSHELRTPMNAIVGFSQILSDEDLKDEHLAYAKMITNNSRNLLSLINDILDFSKIESGKLQIHNEDCLVGDLLADIESMLRPDAAAKDIRFEILQCEPIPEIIQTDSLRLRQCLVNLISNAIKFTETGYVYVNVTTCHRRGIPCIQFDIEDTGIGIPQKKLTSIFDSFTQADSTMTRKYGGTGLGLSITRDLASLLGGWVSVASEEGRGSVFTLGIPLGVCWPDEDTPVWNKYEPADQIFNTEKGNTMYNGKVLVAEDNLSNQKLMAIVLQKMGLEVTIANDGLEAVRECELQSFDMILMDMQMPNMNGYDATRHLRSEGVKTPIIAVTANAMTGDEKKCIDVGCDGYMSKPINRSTLDELIARHLPVQVS